jgi:hypothetical protein
VLALIFEPVFANDYARPRHSRTNVVPVFSTILESESPSDSVAGLDRGYVAVRIAVGHARRNLNR